MLTWFESVMRPKTQTLIKMAIAPKCFGDKQDYTEIKQAAWEEFAENIIPLLEKQMVKHDFLCAADECSTVDLLVYNELLNVLTLYKKEEMVRR